MKITLSSVLFGLGIALFVTSFFLVGITAWTENRRGYDCALMPIAILLDEIQGLFRGSPTVMHSVLEGVAVFLVAWVNPLFLLYASASPFKPRNPIVRLCRVLVPLMIPFCYIVFHYEGFFPREGHFLWLLGMLLVLASEFKLERQSVASS